MKLIREYIKNIVKNSLKEERKLLSNDLILVEPVDNGFFLLDINKLEEFFIKYKEILSDIMKLYDCGSFEFRKQICMGHIKIEKPFKGEYYGAFQVILAYAQKGYGPLLYDIAMSRAKKLVPDRQNVSDKAFAVWNYYFYKRDDVNHYKLDDIDNPITPPTFDDGVISHHKNKDVLNYVYELKNQLDVDSLLSIGKQKIKELEFKHELSNDDTETTIMFLYERMPLN